MTGGGRNILIIDRADKTCQDLLWFGWRANVSTNL